MDQLVQFLLAHGLAVLAAFILAEQLGFPIPAVPALLAMGALVGRGHFLFGPTLLLAACAASLGNFAWYEFGRHGGGKVLTFLCRLSLEPDSCVRETQNRFARYGPRSLLFSKFIPGFSTVAPPLAGLSRVSLWRFLMWDMGGSILWAGAYLLIGFLFSAQLERIAEVVLQLGSWLVVLLVTALLAYIGWKYYERRRFLDSLATARIRPDELMRRLYKGEAITIIDLRQPLEFDQNPGTLPGALRMQPSELAERHQELPRDREIVLYCSCPNDESSASMTLKLHQLGVMWVRPLHGGIDAWRERGYPLSLETESSVQDIA